MAYGHGLITVQRIMIMTIILVSTTELDVGKRKVKIPVYRFKFMNFHSIYFLDLCSHKFLRFT